MTRWTRSLALRY